MLTDPEITLVIFTCQGREHLLQRTFQSFKEACRYNFSKTILAIDGQISQSVLNEIKPGIIVQSFERKGYVQNIVSALKQIDTSCFFWLEDDFLFHKEVPLEYMAKTMKQNIDWAGVFLSRTAPLTKEEKTKFLFGDFYVPDFGYSVSPTLCNTAYLNAAVNSMINYPKDGQSVTYGFETFFDNYFNQNNLKYALIDPGETLQVSHIGKLESTAREYHMINSLNESTSSINKEYISGFGNDRKINLKSKIGLFFKLWSAAFSLSYGLWSSREVYDFAFRIYVASLKKFKH